jgi:hypothetical protein
VEKVEGYDIYSSTIADVLSIPSLTTPITVGLYAKWGSGKSMLISRLISEMKSFTRHNDEPHFELTTLQGALCVFIAVVAGIILALSTHWYIGIAVGVGILVLSYIVLGEYRDYYTMHLIVVTFSLQLLSCMEWSARNGVGHKS